MAGRDNHDKEMLRTLKRIATALEKIAQNTGPKNRTIEISLETEIMRGVKTNDMRTSM